MYRLVAHVGAIPFDKSGFEKSLRAHNASCAVRDYQTKRGALASAPSGRLEVLVVNRATFPRSQSANRQLLLDNARGNENQQLGFVLLLRGLLEEHANKWDVAQEWHLGDVGAGGLFKDAAKYRCIAVIDQNLGFKRLCVYGGYIAARTRNQLPDRILLDFQVHQDLVVWRNLRRDIK